MDISIIVPTYNRKERLKDCLDSLFAQDYPPESFEVIVVDDGSGDGTKELLQRLSGERINLRYFFQAHKGPAAARNLGIMQARASIIGFTDNDCLVRKDWAKNMVACHKQQKDAAVVGGAVRVDLSNIKAAVSQSLSDGAVKTVINGRPEVIFFPTCNVSFKKECLNGDSFNEQFGFPAGEDLDFSWRLYKKGMKFVCNPDVEILHNCHPDILSFLMQAYMYGRGNYLVQHIHRDHPLLKEIKAGNGISFFFGLVVNFIKIPRFSYLLGRKLIRSYNHFRLSEKIKIYIYFTLHKIMYLVGNVAERIRLMRMGTGLLDDTCGIRERGSRKPEFIILDSTHICNLQCNVCEIRKDRQAKEFTTDEIKRLICEAIEWKVEEFVLSGGEPFVRGDILEILNFVKNKKYRIGVLTNGVLLNEEFIGKLKPYLVSNTLSLSISLDALSPHIHDDIRGARGCFAKTSGGLKLLSGLKKDYPNINFNTISIILNENLEELLALAEFLKSLGVNSIQFQPLLANNLVMREREARVKYWIPPARLTLLDTVISGLIDFKRRNPVLVRNSENNLRLVSKYFRGELSNKDVECSYADKVMLIANNGDATTCFDCYGNIRKNSLKQIFESNEAGQARIKVKSCKKPCLLPCFCD